MTKRFLGILALLLTGTILLWAGDVWEDKPSSDWSKKDVHKVLNKSPWVKVVIPQDSGAGMTTRDPVLIAEAAQGGNRQAAQRERAAVRERAGVDQAEVRRMDIEGSVEALRWLERRRRATGRRKRVAPSIGVRWLSSPAMRQAIVRSKQLAGLEDSDELSQFLSIARNYHMIGIGDAEWKELGAPLALKKPAIAEQRQRLIAQFTYIEMEPGGKRVYPVAVVGLSYGFLEPDIVVCFPREENGQPVIGPRTRKLTFHHPSSRGLIHVEFDLARMSREKNPDL